jgi:hypothetical protein
MLIFMVISSSPPTGYRLGRASVTARWPVSARHVVSEPLQQATQRGELLVGEARPQTPIERLDPSEQGSECPLAPRRQLDLLCTTVARVPRPRDQPGGFHAVEVMRQRRPLHPDVLGNLALGPVYATLQRCQDQPGRQRATTLGEGLVEGATQRFRRAGDAQADRLIARRSHGDE